MNGTSIYIENDFGFPRTDFFKTLHNIGLLTGPERICKTLLFTLLHENITMALEKQNCMNGRQFLKSSALMVLSRQEISFKPTSGAA